MESKLVNYQPLSHSRRTKFEECPRAFSFSYLEKIPQIDNIYAAVGTFIHAVIEDFYNNPANKNPRNYKGNNNLRHFEETFNNRFEKDGQNLIELYKKSQVNNSFSSLEEWLESLMKSYIAIEEFIHNSETNENEKFKNLSNFEFWPSEEEDNLSNTELTMEKKFDVKIYTENNDEIAITGFIDQLIQSKDFDENNFQDAQGSLFEEKQQKISDKKINPRTTIIDIKTSKPPKNIKSYEDQLNTYAMFITKETEVINTSELNAGLFFLGGEEEDVTKRIFILDKLSVEEIEKKFLFSSQTIQSVHTKDIETYNQKKLESEIWEPQANALCNWCWYKNLCPYWVERKNSKLEVENLSKKLHEVRHAGGVQYGYEREIKAELIENINQLDEVLLGEIKNAVLKSKTIERQFDFFIKENEIDDPLYDLKNEIKIFLSVLREETFSNSFSKFIKEESIKFSAEDKNIKLDESWQRITTFFNELKKIEFQTEITNANLNEKLDSLLQIGRDEWSKKEKEIISRGDILKNILEIKPYLAGIEQINKTNLEYKVKLFDVNFYDFLSSQFDEKISLNSWLEGINSLLHSLYQQTKNLKRNNLNNAISELIESVKNSLEVLNKQGKEVSKLLSIL